MAVVGAGELHDEVLAGDRAREPDRAHRGLGARRGHAHHLDGRHARGDLGREVDLGRRRRAVARPAGCGALRPPSRSPGGRGRGSAAPTSRRSRRSGAVDVDQLGALAALDEDRVARRSRASRGPASSTPPGSRVFLRGRRARPSGVRARLAGRRRGLAEPDGAAAARPARGSARPVARRRRTTGVRVVGRSSSRRGARSACSSWSGGRPRRARRRRARARRGSRARRRRARARRGPRARWASGSSGDRRRHARPTTGVRVVGRSSSTSRRAALRCRAPRAPHPCRAIVAVAVRRRRPARERVPHPACSSSHRRWASVK